MENSLEDDIIWVYHQLPNMKKPEDIDKITDAPSPGAKSLLAFAMDYRKEFFSKHLEKALKRREQEGTLRDDHRRQFDIFEQIEEQLIEEWNAKRQCPFCQQPLKRATILLPRAQRAGEEPRLPDEAPGAGNKE